MEEKKFEFGKNYIVLDYKVKKLQRESAAYKDDIAGLETTINTKADKSYVDAQDALKVDKTTTVNGKALSSNITLAVEDIEGLAELVTVEQFNDALGDIDSALDAILGV